MKEWIAGIILLVVVFLLSIMWTSQSVDEQNTEKALEAYYYSFCAENNCGNMTKGQFIDSIR
jgi:hypothetical protein